MEDLKYILLGLPILLFIKVMALFSARWRSVLYTLEILTGR